MQAGDPPREKSVRSLGKRVGADCLGDAGASRSITERVASGVTSRGATPVPPVVSTTAAVLGELGDRGRDLGRLVRHDAPLDLVPVRLEQLRQEVAARILSRTCDDPVRHGQNSRLHASSFVFSTSETSETTICLSIALAMS